ncbi:hypothetical protein M9H77_18073 [Catharanthus roseus]|uniref:Uncharacterized protein n=1 Tax=Catharanthus roseus TaxID=4058 RepID=A0ACC0B6G1_CATRO|nr:hypothetical protein M9H77_18073 [Catharanthus roseus]
MEKAPGRQVKSFIGRKTLVEGSQSFASVNGARSNEHWQQRPTADGKPRPIAGDRKRKTTQKNRKERRVGQSPRKRTGSSRSFMSGMLTSITIYVMLVMLIPKISLPKASQTFGWPPKDWPVRRQQKYMDLKKKEEHSQTCTLCPLTQI